MWLYDKFSNLVIYQPIFIKAILTEITKDIVQYALPKNVVKRCTGLNGVLVILFCWLNNLKRGWTA